MKLRPMTRADVPAFAPVFREIVDAGETYAYPEDLPNNAIADLWMEGAHIGTASFMVSSAARGKGVGRALARYVIDWHRRQGYAGIQFNAVVETNMAAVRLWQDLGFRILGTVPGAFRSATHGPVGLHVMFLDLSS